jgi:hypothetical protein
MLKAPSKKGKKTQSKAVKQPKRKRTTTRVGLPMNTGIQTTSVPVANSYGGIPYTSSQSQFGLTNKPPYLLESLIAKAPPTNYLQPTPAPTATTINGGNLKNEPKLKDFQEQGKTQPVDYVDLVAPSKSGNSETQPEYITLQPESKLMKQTLVKRSEYRKKNEIPPEKRVSTMMKMEQHGFIKPKPTLRGGIVQGPPEKYNELRKR